MYYKNITHECWRHVQLKISIDKRLSLAISQIMWELLFIFPIIIIKLINNNILIKVFTIWSLSKENFRRQVRYLPLVILLLRRVLKYL